MNIDVISRTDLLSHVRIGKCDADLKPRGLLVHRARHGLNQLDFDRFAELVLELLHVRCSTLLWIEIEFLDNGLQPRSAQHLFLHRRQSVIQVIIDNRLHVFNGHGGLLHQDRCRGGILLWKNQDCHNA